MERSNLIEGNVYFCCGYKHEDYPFPVVDTYVYNGKDEEGYRFREALDFVGSNLVNNLPKNHRCELESFFKNQELLISDEADIENFITDLDGLIEFLSNLRSHPKAQTFFGS